METVKDPSRKDHVFAANNIKPGRRMIFDFTEGTMLVLFPRSRGPGLPPSWEELRWGRGDNKRYSELFKDHNHAREFALIISEIADCDLRLVENQGNRMSFELVKRVRRDD